MAHTRGPPRPRGTQATDGRIAFVLAPQQRLRFRKEQDGGRGTFVIARVDARLDGAARLTACSIKGVLPHVAPYYEYEFAYQREQHAQYGLTYALTQLRATRPVAALRYAQLAWILRHECRLSEAACARCLEAVPQGSLTRLAGDALLARLSRTTRELLHLCSPYFREAARGTLGRWLPHLAPAVLEQRLAALDPDDRFALLQLSERAPWRLALRGPTKRWRASGLPAPLDPPFLAALAAWAPPAVAEVDEEEDAPLESRPTAAELRAAVALEARLRARLKRRGDLVFLREDAVSPRRDAPPAASGAREEGWDDPEAAGAEPSSSSHDAAAMEAAAERERTEGALALLIGTGAVVPRHVGGRPVYALAAHAVTRTQLCAEIRRLEVRERAHPYALPPVTPVANATLAALCGEQQRAVHMMTQHALSALTGGPGCGKTRVIEAVVQRYAGRPTAVRTLTGSMAAALRERGVAGAATLHRALYRLQQQAAWPGGQPPADAPPGAAAAQAEAAVEVLVVDEASNVPEKLLTRLLAAYPRLRRVLLVFDPDQIPPIGPGQPAVDLLEALPPDRYTRLTENHRTAADARTLIANDRALLQRRFGALRMAVLRPVDWAAPGPEARAELAATGSGVVEVPGLAQPAVLRRALTWTLEHVVLPETGHDALSAAALAHVQIIVLTNELRHAVNAHVEHLIAPPGRPRLYPGKRLTITHHNYARQAFPEVRGAPPGRAPTASRDVPRGLVSEEVSNGEQFVFAAWTDYDVRRHRWSALKTRMGGSLPLQPPAHTLRVLRMACGRELVLCGPHVGGEHNQRGVAAAHIETAWAITVDKAQGREEDIVLPILPPPTPVPGGPRRPRYAQCFRRNHGHVALSRAKRRYIQLGARANLHELARRAPRPRLTLLAADVRPLFADRACTAATRIAAALARTARPPVSDAPTPDADEALLASFLM